MSQTTGGGRQPLRGRIAGRTAARTPSRGTDGTESSFPPPRLGGVRTAYHAIVDEPVNLLARITRTNRRDSSVVRPRGLEPLASCSGGKRSIR
jgi:hypothetical protein